MQRCSSTSVLLAAATADEHRGAIRRTAAQKMLDNAQVYKRFHLG
jgi:hypothetical protein